MLSLFHVVLATAMLCVSFAGSAFAQATCQPRDGQGFTIG